MSNDRPCRFPPRNTIPEVGAIVKLSRATIYDRIKRGLLHVVKDGGRVFVTGEELERYLSAAP